VGPMWMIHALSVFVYAVSAPSSDYMYLNSFAKHYADGQPMDCTTQMDSNACSRAVVDVTQIQVIRGFALPVMQFFAGPALGAISDAFGRRPAVILIRIALAISTAAGAAVACFDLSVWIDFYIGFVGMIPFLPVPLAWYIDRIDHTPSIVMATALVESSCTLASVVGSMLGGFLSLKAAMLIGFLGKIICLLLAIFVLPESLPEEKRIRFTWSNLLPTAALKVLFQSPLVEKLTAIGVIDSFHYNGFYTLSSRFLMQSLAFGRHQTYLQTMVGQLSDMVWLTVGVSMLWPILGQVGILIASTVATACSDILMMLSAHPWQIYMNGLLLGGLGNMNSCVIASIAGKAASAEKQGMFQSALNLVIQVSSALGPAAFMTVYQLLDPTAPGAPSWRMTIYIIYGVLFAVPSLMLSLALRRFLPAADEYDSGFSS
ncbi:Mfsd10, partial [Symbiodinium pilosum]